METSPVYRPMVDLATMEDRHIILTYRLDRAAITELCAQLEPDLISAIRHPTGIPPLVCLWLPQPLLATDPWEECQDNSRGTLQGGTWADKKDYREDLCLHRTGGSLYYSPKNVCQIIVACCMLHNLALRRLVPFLQEDEAEDGRVQ
ncbi:hypothetical protein NDU88_003716 [Pleurodeles waltl]|uniref:Nuclease HARBI1 n=1 Tax=Pleurodeles waltl TaxID=8319 RepID=A0AAV7MBW2_PLEWA|nr:hypothetical protein NDU88_003716 [Pleurodeles waltl]